MEDEWLRRLRVEAFWRMFREGSGRSSTMYGHSDCRFHFYLIAVELSRDLHVGMSQVAPRLEQQTTRRDFVLASSL